VIVAPGVGNGVVPGGTVGPGVGVGSGSAAALDESGIGVGALDGAEYGVGVGLADSVAADVVGPADCVGRAEPLWTATGSSDDEHAATRAAPRTARASRAILVTPPWWGIVSSNRSPVRPDPA
jgi:hypothetical protein